MQQVDALEILLQQLKQKSGQFHSLLRMIIAKQRALLCPIASESGGAESGASKYLNLLVLILMSVAWMIPQYLFYTPSISSILII